MFSPPLQCPFNANCKTYSTVDCACTTCNQYFGSPVNGTCKVCGVSQSAGKLMGCYMSALIVQPQMLHECSDSMFSLSAVCMASARKFILM